MTHKHTVWVQLSLLTARVCSDEVQVKIFRLHFCSVYKSREFVWDALGKCNEANRHEWVLGANACVVFIRLSEQLVVLLKDVFNFEGFFFCLYDFCYFITLPVEFKAVDKFLLFVWFVIFEHWQRKFPWSPHIPSVPNSILLWSWRGFHMAYKFFAVKNPCLLDVFNDIGDWNFNCKIVRFGFIVPRVQSLILCFQQCLLSCRKFNFNFWFFRLFFVFRQSSEVKKLFFYFW